MGVEHYLTCHKCKQFIDCHKCYRTSRLFHNSAVPTKDETTWIEPYWGSRAFWFLAQHKDHGDQVVFTCDCDEEDAKHNLGYEEVLKHKD